MVDYKCYRCGKIYLKKYDFTRHINRKNPCKYTEVFDSQLTQKEESILQSKSNKVNQFSKNNFKIDSDNKKEYMCIYCNNFFSKNSNLHRHNRICKTKINEQENEKEEIFKKLLFEMEQIRQQNQELKNEISEIKNIKINRIKNINNTNNTNNTLDQSNNINNYNIQLVAFGKEDYDKLTEKEYKIIINKGYKSVQEMVKSLHFHKNRPENHNIYISNIRDNYVMIYDGNKWELRNRKETIEELYIAKKDILVDKFDELLNKLPEYAIDKFERFINDEQDDKIKEGILEELKLILYNNKNIPLKTKERLGLLKLT